MRLLGIDYGLRRIGIAVADTDTGAIRGLSTLDRKKKPDHFGCIHAIIQNEKIDTIVCGLPLDYDNRETPMSQQVREFCHQLQSRCGCTAVLVDEGFSSVTAQQLMMHRKKKQRRDKGAVDRLAACLILERYLQENT
jgi:putative Holliday junction resolvase